MSDSRNQNHLTTRAQSLVYDEQFKAIKISVLNYSATGVEGHPGEYGKEILPICTWLTEIENMNGKCFSQYAIVKVQLTKIYVSVSSLQL